MKTFEEALTQEVNSIEYYGNCTYEFKEGFEDGAKWAQTSPELINEILTKYMEWASNLPVQQFAHWDDEEGDFDKTKARIRKEFIEYLNKKG